MTDMCVCIYACVCSYVWAPQAEGVSGKQGHVTLDKGEMKGYDWLFSDVTDCESSQLETIIRCLVTPIVSSPLLYPLFLFSLWLPCIHIFSFFVSNSNVSVELFLPATLRLICFLLVFLLLILYHRLPPQSFLLHSICYFTICLPYLLFFCLTAFSFSFNCIPQKIDVIGYN